MDLSAVGWGIDCMQFKLPHKPSAVGLNYGGWHYNKHNFALLYYTVKLLNHFKCVNRVPYGDILILPNL